MTDAQKPHAGLGPVEHTVGRPGAERAERRKCDDCGHSGDEGGSTTESYCGVCGSTVPYPKEDQCQECGATNCMLIACPECGGRYWELDQDFVGRAHAASAFTDGLSELGARWLAEVLTSFYARKR